MANTSDFASFSNQTDSSNSTSVEIQATDCTPTLETGNDVGVPIIGLPGRLFTALHVLALCSLSITVLISSSLLIYLYVTLSRSRQPCNRQGDSAPRQQQVVGKETALSSTAVAAAADSNAKTSSTVNDAKKSRQHPLPVTGPGYDLAGKSSFWSLNDGERMVVYLAVSDLFFGISHILDHSYMLATRANPPMRICAPMAYVLLSAIFSQWSVVIFSAVSACSLIVFNKKIPVGRYDWRLLLGTFGLGLSAAAVALACNVLGPSGAWCLFNIASQQGRVAINIIGFFEICLFGVLIVAYGAIWIKIQRTAKLMAHHGDGRYHKSARVMMTFVSAFFMQWWPFVSFAIWSLVATPAVVMYLIGVTITNLGGLYNCVAYTVIRRRLQNQNSSSRGQQVVVFDGAIAMTTSSSTVA